MDIRSEKILEAIIKEHLKTGSPVGSSMIVDKYKLDVSPATVRNVMSELEEDGFIIQPHTSAGRIPTEKAWNFHIESVRTKKRSQKNSEYAQTLAEVTPAQAKDAARMMARDSGQAVFWAYSKQDLFYTGISNLLQQQEFSRLNAVQNIAPIIDEIDVIVDEIFDRLQVGVHVLIGSESPFGTFCGSIVSKYRHESRLGMFGMIGPIRMDYERNIRLAESIMDIVND
jgi:heat-inducible transcriptional repressor